MTIEQEIKHITLCTEDDIFFEVVHRCRGAETVLILGQGFPVAKESMHVFARIFDNYDIVLFDYRWVPHFFWLHPAVWVFPFDQLLLQEHKEVVAVVSYVRALKQYKKVIGLAECFSTYTFVEAQVQAIKEKREFFDALILDSCWLSLRDFAKELSRDPLLSVNPTHGGAPSWFTTTAESLFLAPLFRRLAQLVVPQVVVKERLQQLDAIPILFIHGVKDLLVPLADILSMLRDCKKLSWFLLCTPYRHADNLHNKRMYKDVVERFIAQGNVVFNGKPRNGFLPTFAESVGF